MVVVGGMQEVFAHEDEFSLAIFDGFLQRNLSTIYCSLLFILVRNSCRHGLVKNPVGC